MSHARALALVASLLLAAPAGAATINPDRFDDPGSGTNCAVGHPAGTCSLRAALTASISGDTIALGAGTYTLSQGQLLVQHNVVFTGAGPTATTIRQQKAGSRVIEFDNSTTASMAGLTLTGGQLTSADAANGTSGSPNGSSQFATGGGAIYAHGTLLDLTLVDIVGNTVTGGKGGNGYNGAGGAGGNGGSASGSAIDLSTAATLNNVIISGNVAQGGAGGTGGSNINSATGGAGGNGGTGSGAITGGPSMNLVLRNSTISGNKAYAGRGGDGGNGGPSGGTGGAGGQSVRGAGGAIFSNGHVTVVNSTIAGNELHGGDGGAGGNGGFLGAGGAGGAAQAGDSGGIALFNGATGVIASATIVGNGAFSGAPGAGGSGTPAGTTPAAQLPNAGNYDVYGTSTTLDIRDTVIAGGIAQTASSNCSVGGTAVVTSHGYNLEDHHQCVPTPTTGDRKDLAPLLGPLQDNGGPTQTMAPLAGSPLIDGGPATCTDPANADATLATDQRGVARGTPCDIGAYEGVAPSATTAPAVTGTTQAGQTVSCQPGTFGGDLPQTLDTVWLRDGQPAGSGPQYAIPAADAGHGLACRVTATNAYGSASADSAPVTITAAPPPPPGGGSGTVTLAKLAIRPAKLHRRGHARVTFTLSADARVTFALCRVKGKRCVRVKKGAPRALSGRAGLNRVRLNAKGLRRGRYRLTATPAGGKPRRAGFKVVA